MKLLTIRYLPILLVLLLLSVGGCQTLDKRQSDIQLEKVLYSYQNTVRWASPERTYVFMKPDVLAGESIPPDLDNVRVTAYEVIQPPLPFSENLVKQTVRISYVLQDRQIQRSLMDEQIWEYQKEDKIWYRINPMPDYK